MSIWSQAKAAGLATPDESGASGVCESERGVNPCERYHRNGTGGVVTCACRPSSHHSNRATTLRRYQIHGRRACEREATIQSNPRPPQEKGKVFFVPRSLGRRTARPDVGSPRILATVRPPARPLRTNPRALPYRRAHVCARTCAHVHPPNVGARTRTSLLASRPRSRVLRILRGYFWWRPVALVVYRERAALQSPR